MVATKMYSTPQTENKTLPRCVHILCLVVLMGVQRVNGFKSGRGSLGLRSVSTLFPQTLRAVSYTTKRVLFQRKKNLYRLFSRILTKNLSVPDMLYTVFVLK